MPVREDADVEAVDARQHQSFDVREDRVLRRLAREHPVELEVLPVLRRLAVRPLDDDARLAAALAADLVRRLLLVVHGPHAEVDADAALEVLERVVQVLAPLDLPHQVAVELRVPPVHGVGPRDVLLEGLDARLGGLLGRGRAPLGLGRDLLRVLAAPLRVEHLALAALLQGVAVAHGRRRLAPQLV